MCELLTVKSGHIMVMREKQEGEEGEEGKRKERRERRKKARLRAMFPLSGRNGQFSLNANRDIGWGITAGNSQRTSTRAPPPEMQMQPNLNDTQSTGGGQMQGCQQFRWYFYFYVRKLLNKFSVDSMSTVSCSMALYSSLKYPRFERRGREQTCE